MKTTRRLGKGATQLKESVHSLVDVSVKKLLRSLESSCDCVIRVGMSSPIELEKRGTLLKLSKLGVSSPAKKTLEFTMKLRLDANLDWWPIEFFSSDGRAMSAEIQSNGKNLTNVRLQTELIDIANRWGRSLLAQLVAKELQPTVFRYLKPDYDPKFSTLERWAKALDCKVKDLFKE